MMSYILGKSAYNLTYCENLAIFYWANQPKLESSIENLLYGSSSLLSQNTELTISLASMTSEFAIKIMKGT